MSSSIPDLSALHCVRVSAPTTTTKELAEWTVETEDSTVRSTATHPHFNHQTGVYTVPKDGIYLLNVQLIPIGGATLHNAHRTRKRVHYALHIEDPAAEDDEYLDVGSHNLGQTQHLREGVKISCLRMAGAPGGECVRLRTICLQRKRKREEKVLSKKEMKRRKRAAGRAVKVLQEGTEDEVEDSSESEWEYGFESDSTSDELPTSGRGVGRLAKRLKTLDQE